LKIVSATFGIGEQLPPLATRLRS